MELYKSGNKQRYLCRKVKRAMIYLRIILSRFCSSILIFKVAVSVQYSAFFYELKQNIVKNSQVKTFNVGLTRNTVHLEAASGNHTLLF
jgi:hypothetical protein